MAEHKKEATKEVTKEVSVATATATKTARPPTIVHSIKMRDGRVVDFPGKRRLQKETFITPEGHVTVVLDFVNGETRKFVPKKEMYPIFVGHGAEQKLGDEMAGIDDLDDAILAIDELIENLNKGEWSQKREAGALAGASLLVKAMAEYTGKDIAVVKEFLKDKSAAEKAALRSSKLKNKAGVSIKEIIDRLEEEKAARAGKVDAAELLAGFAA